MSTELAKDQEATGQAQGRTGIALLAYVLLGVCFGITPKKLERGIRYAVGGTIFGLGWALTGACPGPLFALVGNGVTVMIVAVGSALVGTWLYGLLRPRLPH